MSLLERAQAQYDEAQAAKLQKKIDKNQFDFNDFLEQIQQLKKMGNIKDLIGMIPGAGKMLKDVNIDNDAFKGVEAIIHSMTPAERQHPELLNASRKQRIANGSGRELAEVNRMIKQFDEMRKMLHTVSKFQNGGAAKSAKKAKKHR